MISATAFDTATVYALAEQLGVALRMHGWRVSCAESCTGGGIASAITDVPGSSGWFDAGWVSYANSAKENLLGVPAAIIRDQGAVSEAVALAMATGAQERSNSQLSVAVSGIAGPGGGSADKPVGTVCFGFCHPGGVFSESRHFTGNRHTVRQQTIAYALSKLIDLAQQESTQK